MKKTHGSRKAMSELTAKALPEKRQKRTFKARLRRARYRADKTILTAAEFFSGVKLKHIIAVCSVIVTVILAVVIVAAVNGGEEESVIMADFTLGAEISAESPEPVEVRTLTPPERYTVSFVFYEKDNIICTTEKRTVGELVDILGIELSEEEQLRCDMDQTVSEDTVVNIDNVSTESVTETVYDDYETEYVDVQSIPYGTTQVHQNGIAGTTAVEYTVTYVNGVEMKREEVNRYVTSYPTTQIIYRGVGGAVNIDGEYYPYSFTDTFKSTVYTVYNGVGGTASGRIADESVIAVDPSVIPLGSRVYIEGVGIRIAADTGTAIKGNFIDIYFDKNNPLFASWGVKYVKVYVLK